MNPAGAWPELRYDETESTRHLIHMLAQMAGKIRMALMPHENHWWEVPLSVSTRGLTTGAMPYGEVALQIDIDLRGQRIRLQTSAGDERVLPLVTGSVSTHHERIVRALDDLDTPVRFWPMPVEVAEPVRFDEDTSEREVVPEHAHRLAQAIWQAHRVLTQHHAGFVGKSSPVQFFWGGFDLAVTRFSGRLAPPHPPVPGLPDVVVAEAYSHEVSSAGWWPGDARHPAPAFFAYAYPEPAGYKGYPVDPREAYYHEELREFVLPYDAVRAADSPDDALLSFLRTTYEAAAELAEWDRIALELPAPPMAIRGRARAASRDAR